MWVWYKWSLWHGHISGCHRLTQAVEVIYKASLISPGPTRTDSSLYTAFLTHAEKGQNFHSVSFWMSIKYLHSQECLLIVLTSPVTPFPRGGHSSWSWGSITQQWKKMKFESCAQFTQRPSFISKLISCSLRKQKSCWEGNQVLAHPGKGKPEGLPEDSV